MAEALNGIESLEAIEFNGESNLDFDMTRFLLASRKANFELTGSHVSLKEAKQLIQEFPDKILQLKIKEFYDSPQNTKPEEVKSLNR